MADARYAMPRFRLILTFLLVVAVLAAGAVGAVRAAWWGNPLAPPGTLVAPDCWVAPDSRGWSYVVLAGRAEVQTAGTVIFSWRPDGVWGWNRAGSDGFWRDPVGPYSLQPGQSDVQIVEFRLSGESGFGPLRTVGRVFVLDPNAPLAAVDLEGARRFSRYDLQAYRRDWLVERLAGRRPIYLADVTPGDYDALQSSLRSAGWPDGPLVMWSYRSSGERGSRGGVARRLLGLSGLDLAVLADIPDNQQAFRRPGAERVVRINWPKEDDGETGGSAD